MPRVYELPTHLQVDDTLLLGLTARQLVRITIAASVAYELWDLSAAVPVGVRIGATGLVALSGLLLALLQPGARPLDQWVLAFFLFCARPRRRSWRATTASNLVGPKRDGWAELSVDPAWLGDDATQRASSFGPSSEYP